MSSEEQKTEKNNLNEKDFHDIVLKQYELINQQYNTIRQMQIDQEERDAEFDLSRLIPGFLRKKKNTADNTSEPRKDSCLFRKFFNYLLLVSYKNFVLIVIVAVLALTYGLIVSFSTEKTFESKIKFASGVLTNSYYEGTIENLGIIARSASSYLAKKINITEEEASKIKNIKFNEFKNYTETKKKIINDSTFEEVSFYPFFEVTLYVTDNSILDNVEKGLIDYLEKDSYTNERVDMMAAGINSQLKDLDKFMSNLDSMSTAATHRMISNSNNNFFVKETGLDSKGIILNQNEPLSQIISTITENNKDFSQLKGVLTEQQAELSSKFGIVESHTISNKPIGYSWYVVLYLILGIVLGFVLAILKTEISKAVKKAKILSEQEKID